MDQDVQIPKKSFFKQDEVCTITSVKPYVLRFWETEFEEISPVVSMTGQKLYEHKDIEAILKIKTLLFEQKLTVDKARAILKNPELAVMEAKTEEVEEKPLLKERSYWEDMQDVKARLMAIQSKITTLKSRQNWLN